MDDLLSLRAVTLLFFLCGLTFLLLYIKKSFIIDQIAAFEILEERGQGGVLALLAGLQYLSIPLIYVWKFSVIALVLWLGGIFLGYRIHYAACWHVAAAAEYVFIVPELLKIGWFLFIESDPGYFEVRAFYPFSLAGLADRQAVASYWLYPLKALNLFELLYWLLLLAGVHLKLRRRYGTAIAIVFSSYVPLFIFWLVYYVTIARL